MIPHDPLDPVPPLMAFKLDVAADLLGLSESDTAKLISNGHLKVIWTGGEKRVPMQALHEFRALADSRKYRRGLIPLIDFESPEKYADQQKNRRDLVDSRSALAAALNNVDKVLEPRARVDGRPPFRRPKQPHQEDGPKKPIEDKNRAALDHSRMVLQSAVHHIDVELGKAEKSGSLS